MLGKFINTQIKIYYMVSHTDKKLHVLAEDITKNHPMDYLSNHPFFLIRWIERNRRRVIVKMIRPKKGEVIADIGCEKAHILSEIYFECPYVKKLIGIDVSKHALIEAKKVAEWEGWLQKSRFIISDAEKISLPNNSVDVAISSNVLEHLRNPKIAFDELIRITKPGGRIIINLPNEKRIIAIKRLFMRYGFKKLLGNLKLVTPGHLHYPDKQFVKDLARGKAKIKRIFLGPKISLLGLYIYAELEPLK